MHVAMHMAIYVYGYLALHMAGYIYMYRYRHSYAYGYHVYTDAIDDCNPDDGDKMIAITTMVASWSHSSSLPSW